MTYEQELCEYFEWLEEEFGQRLRAHIGWHYSSLSEADIDDVYQNTMIAMLVRWRKKPGTRGDKDVGALLKKIAKNKACDFIKSRQPDFTTDLAAATNDGRVDWSHRYPSLVEREELARLIVEAFDLMDEEHKWVWYVFATNYPLSRKFTKLAEFAGMPGQPRRAARLLRSGCGLILKHLSTKGYDLE